MSFTRLRYILLVLVTMASPVLAQDYGVDSDDGVNFFQLDYPNGSPPVPDSAVGLLEANLLRLRATSGLATGFLNVVLDGNWVVRNMVVPLERDYPYSHLSTQFDLGIAEGIDVSSLTAAVVFTQNVALQAPASVAATFPVAAREVVVGGTEVGGGGSPKPPTIEDVLFGDPGRNRSIFQLDHPNQQAALNQCYPMAVANSLQFLADTTDLVLPHSHVPGIKGDDSLVGQLDTAMDRTATARDSGEGVYHRDGITGKLKYLAENGLQDRIQTRHWGPYAGNDATQTVSGKTATSTSGGSAIPFDEIVSSLERGEDCEIAYHWGTGAHAVDIVAAGYTNGEPWIIENSDSNQESDEKGGGPEGFEFSYLKDTDEDGELNLNGKDELNLLICQRYIPPPEPTQTSLPPEDDDEELVVEGDLKITKTTDPSNHSCCADAPPGAVTMHFHNGTVTIKGNASWLPITGTFDGSNFSGSSIAPVAGFTDSANSLSGILRPHGIDATISLGTNGALPGGDPISWDVQITPTTAWPWPAFQTNTVIKPRLRVNGFRHETRVPQGEPVALTLSLDAAGEQFAADWFLAVQMGNGTFLSFGLDGSWSPGLRPALQAPLRDLPNTPVFKQLGGLPQGSYRLFFAVDSVMNGEVDMPNLVYDSVNLTVE